MGAPAEVNASALAHLDRINGICEALRAHPAWKDLPHEMLFDRLSCFDGEYWTFVHYLSRALYEETLYLLRHWRAPITSSPEVAIVMPVYRAEPMLLKLAIDSAIQQIGVDVRLWLSLDGDPRDAAIVSQLLEDLDPGPQRVSVIDGDRNRGVGLCRNQALARIASPYFTFLDADDLFHPLRCLHAWLALENEHADRVNTGSSRVSVADSKIVLVDQSLSSIGRSSFLARARILNSHGFLTPLRFYEDSEYEMRHAYYGLRTLGVGSVGHYRNVNLIAQDGQLSSRWRSEVHVIVDHPYLCASITTELDPETSQLIEHYRSLYRRLGVDDLPAIFPAFPSEDQV